MTWTLFILIAGGAITAPAPAITTIPFVSEAECHAVEKDLQPILREVYGDRFASRSKAVCLPTPGRE